MVISQDTLKHKSKSRHSIQQKEYLNRNVWSLGISWPPSEDSTLSASSSEEFRKTPHLSPSPYEGAPESSGVAQSEEPPRAWLAYERPFGPSF